MPARLYLDHNVPAELFTRLRSDEHDVLTSAEAGNERLDDEPQLEFAAAANRILVTLNLKHFKVIAERWAAEGKSHAGLIYASGTHPPAALHRWITATLIQYTDMKNLSIGIGPWLDS